MDSRDEYLDLKPLGLYLSETKWLCNNTKESKYHESNQTRAEQCIINLYGFDPNGIRDWNEEI